MADVTFHCLNCGKTIIISQFVDQSTLSCPDCGSSLRLAAPAKEFNLKNSQLNLKHNRGAVNVHSDTKPNEGTTQSDLMQGTFERHKSKEKKSKMGKSHLQVFGGIMLFLALGGIMYFIRYSGHESVDTIRGYLESYGIWVVLLGHLVILSIAMKDSFMQGLLCLLIPCYSIYYLLICDHIFLRATFLAILVGIA